eukprot:1959-Heterococcus_DN1.PRE.2
MCSAFLEVALYVKSQSTFHITMTDTTYETRHAQLRLLLVDQSLLDFDCSATASNKRNAWH